MRLKGVKIGNATYFLNEKQVAEAGGLEKAAKKEHEKRNPVAEMKPKEVKDKKTEKVETK